MNLSGRLFQQHSFHHVTLFLLILLFSVSCSAQSQQSKNVKLKLIAQGLRAPVHLTHAGDKSGRLFIVERPGRIMIYDPNRKKVLEQPFLDIRKRVRSGGEMGLLSVSFHPDFPKKNTFYVNYTTTRYGSRHTVISEFRTNDNRTSGKENSERVLLKIKQPWANHNGGQLQFGPEGYLYIGMGDGGYANDPQNNGQNLGTLHGAMLRIDVNKQENGKPYGIPDDNPFINKQGAKPEIYAYGLRNPWRFSFDRKTGTLWAGDVGQNDWEEVDIIEKGKNYGWRIMEGNIFNPNIDVKKDDSGLTKPVHVYPTGQKGTSVLGGFVYRGKNIPEWQGEYIFGDYTSGYIWGLQFEGNKITNHRVILREPTEIFSSFGEDEEGELYIVALQGRIYKFVPK